MIITFDRRGFANNSSSSHSIIFSPNLKARDDYDEYFGWDYFTCATKKAKADYMFATLESNFRYGVNEYKSWCLRNVAELIEKYQIDFDHEYSVDHQSKIQIPVDYHSLSKNPSAQFFKELFNELVENPYFILGGNDNNDYTHILQYNHQNFPVSNNVLTLISMITDTEHDYCVKDNLTNEWILSNRTRGNIFKFIFSNDIKKNTNGFLSIDTVINTEDSNLFTIREQKSSFPYLVDIKITDYCDIGCPFCYQSSTLKGQHANTNFIINNVLPELKKSNVFEIVLGGGEPTKHPDLLKICSAADDLQLKIGVTSKNFNWWLQQDPTKIKIHSVAFSCQTIEDISKVEKIKNLHSYLEIYIQLILELHTIDHLEKMIRHVYACHINNITFLGYKSFGFGENIIPKQINSNWIVLIKNLAQEYWFHFGIDSVLVKKYKSELIHNDVKPEFLVGTDGKQTCYVDTVKSTIAASSFTTNNVIDYDFKSDDFLNIFSNF